MKRFLLQLAFLLLPFFSLAQDEAPVLEHFVKKAWWITTTFHLNDQVSVIQIQTGDVTFDLAAVDDKMQVLWHTQLEGCPVSSGKFGGHILAITANKYKAGIDQVVGPFTAVLIDEKTGKEISRKVIYDSKSNIPEFANCYFNDGSSNFTFIVWQARESRTMLGYPNVEKLIAINALSVVKLDDNLNPAVSRLTFPDPFVVNLDCNNKGDVFLVTHPKDSKVVSVARYNSPKYEQLPGIDQNIDMHSESGINYKNFVVTTSDTNRNVLYMALVHPNANKDKELTVSKFDFGNHTVNTTSEVFSKQHVKEIENAYVPFNKDLKKLDIGPSGLTEKYIKEWNGTLLVVLTESESARFVDPINGKFSGVSRQDSHIINGYDTNLSPKFQQLMPTYNNGLTFSAHGRNNSIYIHSGNLFGQLDLSSGRWQKLQKTSKIGSKVMWFTSDFIIPYRGPSGIRAGVSDVNLQLNNY